MDLEGGGIQLLLEQTLQIVQSIIHASEIDATISQWPYWWPDGLSAGRTCIYGANCADWIMSMEVLVL